jgi:anti-sigma28 factor (negative regulator of flagellin synthesis)
MTNRINAYSPSQTDAAAADAAASAVRSQSKDKLAPSTPADSGAPASEAVTITDGARATAQLLDQARAADGVDHASVARLKTAIQSQSYHVAAEPLASSIVSAMAEIKS